jgi:hypothetical protein
MLIRGQGVLLVVCYVSTKSRLAGPEFARRQVGIAYTAGRRNPYAPITGTSVKSHIALIINGDVPFGRIVPEARLDGRWVRGN